MSRSKKAHLLQIDAVVVWDGRLWSRRPTLARLRGRVLVVSRKITPFCSNLKGGWLGRRFRVFPVVVGVVGGGVH